MLTPSQFSENEAWLAFVATTKPIQTEIDGDFNLMVLVDAATGVICNIVLFSVDLIEPSQNDASKLFELARARQGRLPSMLVLPGDLYSVSIPAVAAKLGVDVVRIPEDQLVAFTNPVREAFSSDSFPQ